MRLDIRNMGVYIVLFVVIICYGTFPGFNYWSLILYLRIWLKRLRIANTSDIFTIFESIWNYDRHNAILSSQYRYEGINIWCDIWFCSPPALPNAELCNSFHWKVHLQYCRSAEWFRNPVGHSASHILTVREQNAQKLFLGQHFNHVNNCELAFWIWQPLLLLKY